MAIMIEFGYVLPPGAEPRGSPSNNIWATSSRSTTSFAIPAKEMDNPSTKMMMEINFFIYDSPFSKYNATNFLYTPSI
jgi:hypothetical protein